MPEQFNYNFARYFIAFSIFIILVSLFSNTYGSTDTGDYLGVAKGFTGSFITKMRSTHSWVYGLLLAQPLKVFYSPITAKLFNVMWLILIALLLYAVTNSKKVFLIYTSSPIVWFSAPWVSPIMLGSLLLLASYIFIKKFEESRKSFHLIISGIFLGMATVIWDTALFLSFFFILSFFFNKRVKELLIFIVPFSLAFSVRLVIDFLLFNFPLFSLFRVFGGNLSAVLKLGNYTNVSYPIIDYILLFISISPLFILLIYRFIKEDYKKYSQEIAFLILSFLLILMLPQTRYLMGIAPLAILLLANKFKSKKEILLHIFLSFILILYFITPYFGPTYEYRLASDLKQIEKDFPSQVFLAGSSENPDLYVHLGMYYWGRDIKKVIPWQEYDYSRFNKTDFQHYRVESKTKLDVMRKLWFEIALSRASTETYENIEYQIAVENQSELQFKLVKNYSLLKVFKKE